MDNSEREKVLIALDCLAELEYLEMDAEGEDILIAALTFLCFSR